MKQNISGQNEVSPNTMHVSWIVAEPERAKGCSLLYFPEFEIFSKNSDFDDPPLTYVIYKKKLT